MKTLLALVLSVLTLSASANIVVYKNAITQTETGGAKTQVTVVSGWTIIDLETLNTTTIFVDAKHKQFTVSYPTVGGYQVGASKVVTNTIVQFSDQELQGCTAKGVNLKVAVNYDAPTRKFSYATVPTVLLISGNQIETADDGTNYFYEFKGTFALDGVTTLAVNKSGIDDSTEADNLTAALLAKGYTQD